MDGSLADAPSSLALITEGSSDSFDLHNIIAIFRRRLPLILGVGLVVLIGSILYTFQQTPMYTATAQVMIDAQRPNLVDISALASGTSTDAAQIDTEVQVLKSRSLAEAVVKNLKLDQDADFNPALKKTNLFDSILRLGQQAAPVRSTIADQILAERQHQAVVDHALAGLKVSRLLQTYVIQISYTSPHPFKAAELANAFAKGYLVQQLDAKFDAIKDANEWLNGKVADLRQQLQDAETAVEQYKIANNLMSANGNTLTEQEISALDTQLAVARAAQAEADARLATAKSQTAQGSNGEDLGEAMNSPTIQALRAQRTTLMQQIADLSGRYGERHPEMLKAKRELADIDSQIQQEIQTIISSLEAQDQVARQRTASVEASVAQSKNSLAENSKASVKLDELQRNADSIKALYDSYLNRFKETSNQQGIETSDARIVSEAKIPNRPSYPNKANSLLMGLAIAFAAGFGAAFAAEKLDSGIGTAEDLERELDISYLGAIPALASTLDDPGQASRSKTAPVDFVMEKPLSSFSEAFRNLRASVLFSRLGHQVKVVAVTSSLPGEGKTTTSLALARTMAISGAKTIVIDCDLRQRGINRVLTYDPQKGLLEVLNGSVTLEEALIDDASGAKILPLTKSAYTPRDVFGTDAMKSLVARLREEFDAVVIDTAPVLPIADTRVLAPLADVVVLLVRWRKTPKKASESALRLLKSVHAYVAGAALTQVDLKAQARYGYGDPGYYYRSYRKYYGQ